MDSRWKAAGLAGVGVSLVASLAVLVCLAAGLLGGQHHQSTRYRPSTLGR